jgi:hypothetical protein
VANKFLAAQLEKPQKIRPIFGGHQNFHNFSRNFWRPRINHQKYYGRRKTPDFMLCEARCGRQQAHYRAEGDGSGDDIDNGGMGMAAGDAAFITVETTDERTVLRGVHTWHGCSVQDNGWRMGPGVMRTGRQVGPMRQLFFQITNPEFSFSHGKNRYNSNKKPKKISGGRKSNLEHFLLLQRLPNLHGF